MTMFGLFSRKPILDDDSRRWLFDAFGWALRNFDAELFRDHTVLVLPTNAFFPGRVDSLDGMANLIFDKVKLYAGLSHWPTLVADRSSCPVYEEPTTVNIDPPLRRADGVPPETVDEHHCLLVPYNPQQLNKPEGIIASFSHLLAHYLGQMAEEPPPGGADYWPQTTEVLAVFLGFGLMFANSAYTFRGGCGRCYNPMAERTAALTETEATYALALFAVLKGIPNADVTGHLKGHLRGIYRRAVKEIQHSDELERLKSL